MHTVPACLNALDALVQDLHTRLLALASSATPAQERACAIALTVWRDASKKASTQRVDAPYQNLDAPTAHARMALRRQQSALAKTQASVQACLVRLTGLLTASAACQASRLWPAIMVEADVHGVQACLSLGSHPDGLLPRARTHPIFAYESGALHRACSALAQTGPIHSGPFWRVLTTTPSHTEEAHTVQAPTAADALAWAALTCIPTLFIGQGRVLSLARMEVVEEATLAALATGLRHSPPPAYTPPPRARTAPPF